MKTFESVIQTVKAASTLADGQLATPHVNVWRNPQVGFTCCSVVVCQIKTGSLLCNVKIMTAHCVFSVW